MGALHIMGPTGDVRLEWDPEDAESVAKAKAEWKTLKDAGMEFFAVEEAKGRRVKFSKGLGKVIAAPGVAKPAERAAETPGGRSPRPKAMRGGPNAAFAAPLRRPR